MTFYLRSIDAKNTFPHCQRASISGLTISSVLMEYLTLIIFLLMNQDAVFNLSGQFILLQTVKKKTYLKQKKQNSQHIITSVLDTSKATFYHLFFPQREVNKDMAQHISCFIINRGLFTHTKREYKETGHSQNTTESRSREMAMLNTDKMAASVSEENTVYQWILVRRHIMKQ